MFLASDDDAAAAEIGVLRLGSRLRTDQAWRAFGRRAARPGTRKQLGPPAGGNVLFISRNLTFAALDSGQRLCTIEKCDHALRCDGPLEFSKRRSVGRERVVPNDGGSDGVDDLQ
jgi:hypothetical protein